MSDTETSDTTGTGDELDSGYDGLMPMWEHMTAGGPALGAVRQLVLAANGDAVVLGTAGGWVWLGRFAPDGTLRWSAKDQEDDYTAADTARVVLDAADNATLVLTNDLGGQIKLLQVKFDAAGNELWRRHEAAGPRKEFLAGLVADPAGNLYMGGMATSSTETDVWLASYDADGNPRFDVVGDADPSRRAVDLAWDPAGNLAMLESESRSLAWRTYSTDGNLIAEAPLLASTWPITVWASAFLGTNIVVAGTESITGDDGVVSSSGWLRAFDPSGATLWTSTLPDVVMRVGADIAVTPDGGLLLVASQLDGLDQNVWLGRFDGGGGLTATYGYDSGAWDEGRSIALLPEGRALLGGSADGGLGRPPSLWLSDVAFTP